MKNLKLLILFLVPCLLIMSSCGSTKYGKGVAKKVEMPFAEEDYVDNSTYVYSIQSTRGTGSKSAIKSATLTKAKNELSAKVRAQIISNATVNQYGEDGADFSESFKATITDNVNKIVESTVLIKSEWLTYGKSISGKEEFEYWGVYRVKNK